jgi:hypothetical protein
MILTPLTANHLIPISCTYTYASRNTAAVYPFCPVLASPDPLFNQQFAPFAVSYLALKSELITAALHVVLAPPFIALY